MATILTEAASGGGREQVGFIFLAVTGFFVDPNA
jgi:hypothetical protein